VSRRDERRAAVFACYQRDVTGTPVDDLIERSEPAVSSFTRELVEGVEEHREELDAVWTSVGEDADDEAVQLWTELAQLHAAAQQVMAAGTPEQITTVTATLADARKSIYRLLAE
jgi:transcription termination factor NusB